MDSIELTVQEAMTGLRKRDPVTGRTLVANRGDSGISSLSCEGSILRISGTFGRKSCLIREMAQSRQ